MTPNIKAKWSFLSHIKLGAQFYLVEISLEKYISQSTYSQFKGVLEERKYTRDQVRIEEEYYHKAVEIENNNIFNSNNYEAYYSTQRKSFNSNYSNTSNKINSNEKTFDPTLDEAFNTKSSNNREIKEENTVNDTLLTNMNIKDEVDKCKDKEKNTQNTDNIKQKAKLQFLLDGGTYDQLQKEEEKKIKAEKEIEKNKLKEIIYDEEFPELNSEFFEGNSKKKSFGGGGGRKKKKKFVELNI